MKDRPPSWPNNTVFSSSGYYDPKIRYHSQTCRQKLGRVIRLPKDVFDDMNVSVSPVTSDGIHPSIYCFAFILAVHPDPPIVGS